MSMGNCVSEKVSNCRSCQGVVAKFSEKGLIIKGRAVDAFRNISKKRSPYSIMSTEHSVQIWIQIQALSSDLVCVTQCYS